MEIKNVSQRIFISGATGFIGQHLIKTLLQQNKYIGALIRNTTTVSRGRIVAIQGDLTIHSTLANICDGYDTVFHLAGFAHVEDATDERSNIKHWQVTVEGTRALLSEAKRAGVKRFIFASSVKAFGESSTDCIDETSPSVPTTGYGAAKLEAEKLVLEASSSHQLHTVVLRLPIVYGAGNKGNIPRMIAAIDHGRFPPLLKLHNKRSMVHVDDVVQALLLATDKPLANKNVYVVTDGCIYSTSDIYVAICNALGKSLPSWSMPIWALHAGAKLGDLIGKILGQSISLNSSSLEKLLGSACYKSDKIQRELRFIPRHTLYDALPEMIADYREIQRT